MVFRGSGTALVTPFKDGQIDWSALQRLVEHQVEGGTRALIACGTTGEPSTLSVDEQLAVVTFVLKHAQGLPVIAGVGGNNTAEVVDTSVRMQDLGVDALLAVTPYYNKTTQRGLVAHYSAIADAVETPIILYNVPSRTGLNLEPQTTAVLADHERVVALKEANASMAQIMEDFRLFGDKLSIYSGNDDLVYPILALGGAGVISVASNLVPERMQAVVDRFDAGDWQGSLEVVQEIAPLIALLFAQVSPLPIKAALSKVGLASNEVRLPLVPLTDDEAAPLFAAMDRLEIR